MNRSRMIESPSEQSKPGRYETSLLFNPSSPSLAALTAREREVLRLIAEGSASKQISAELGISINTVNNHRASIHAKLGVQTSIAAVRIYLAAQ